MPIEVPFCMIERLFTILHMRIEKMSIATRDNRAI